MTARDPVEDGFAALQRERWRHADHEAELLQRLEHASRASLPLRRWPLVAAGALLGVVATAATVTAADGWRWVAKLIGARVVEVERDGAGAVRKLILEDEQGRHLHLRPVDEPMVQVVEVERGDGGVLRLRVLREAGLGLVPTWAAEPGSAPEPGQRMLLRRVTPERFRGELREASLLLTPFVGGARQRVVLLERVAGTTNRYSDGDALVEIID